MQTPEAGSSTRPSWLADLDAYLSSHPATPPATTATQRHVLAAAVRSDPTSPDTWLAFLSSEETCQHGNVTATLTSGAGEPGAAAMVSLLHLYHWATQLVPRSRHQAREEYIRLWLGYARQQWRRSRDDARDTFKTLKNQHIGDTCAYLYSEWASLEHAAGNISKALAVLSKGLRQQAQPAGVLERLQAEMQSGTFNFKNGTHTFTDTLFLQAQQQPEQTRRDGAVASGSCPAAAAAGGPASSAGAAAAAHLHPSARSAAAASVATPSASPPRLRHPMPSLGERAPDPGLEGPPTCTSLHSSSTRSTSSAAAGHLGEGMQAVSARPGATYLSCTTDRSASGGLEDATISCSAAAGEGAISGAGAAAGAAQLDGASTAGGAGDAAAAAAASAGGHTATLGIRRFGFKTRAQRVGGGGGAPASDAQPSAPPAAPAPAAPLEASHAHARVAFAAHEDPPREQRPAAVAAAAPAAAPAADEGGGGGRKRPSEAMAPPLADSSPKMAAALVGGAVQRASAPPSLSEGTASAPGAAAGAAQPPAPPVPRHAPTAFPGPAAAPPQPSPRGAADSDDSAPLIGSRLAARLATDRGTPVPRHVGGSVAGGGASSSEGTPEALGAASLDSTPELLLDVAHGGDGCTSPGARPAFERRAVEAPGAAASAPSRPAPDVRGGASSQRNAAGAAEGQMRPPPAREPLRQVGAADAQARAALRPPQPSAAAAAPPPKPSQAPAAASPAQPPQPQPQQQQQQQQQRPPSVQPPQRPAQQQQQQQLRPCEDAQTVYVRGTRYTKLECVGRGGSSKVFKVMAPNCKISALKRIRLQGRDPEAARGFLDEITLLKRLRNRPNIIQLVDWQVFHEEGLIYMVQEYGEIDLARLLAKHDAARRSADAGGGGGIDENFIRLYWQQMLQAVATVHDMRIVHSDLKPANFLMVEGGLKLIDFGIAKAMAGDTTSIARESQVGTLNYMSPEAILGGGNNILGGPPAKVGRASDIWSLGCILYQMVYGRTPFAELPFIPKMHAIVDPNHTIRFPPALASAAALDVMRRCLERDVAARATMQELLDHPFLHPDRAPAAAPPPPAAPPPLPPSGVDVRQLRELLSQAAAAGASGQADIDRLTQELLRQLNVAAAAQGGGGGADAAAEAERRRQQPAAAAAAVEPLPPAQAPARGGGGSGGGARAAAAGQQPRGVLADRASGQGRGGGVPAGGLWQDAAAVQQQRQQQEGHPPPAHSRHPPSGAENVRPAAAPTLQQAPHRSATGGRVDGRAAGGGVKQLRGTGPVVAPEG